MKLTIFVGTYNRTSTLLRSLRSFRKLKTPYRIVIVDNGSDHPKALAMLDKVEKRADVAKVYRLGKIHTMEALTDNYSIAFADQYVSSEDWFAVTDADICFDGSSPDSINAYYRVAKHTGKAAGPHLRIDKGSHGYPLRQRVLATESRLLYRSTMDWLEEIPYSHWPIDTTFHLFPAEKSFRRLYIKSVRVGPPYDAMHLDWYLNIFDPVEENRIYIPNYEEGNPGGWGRGWISGFWHLYLDDPEKAFDHIIAQPTGRDGTHTEFIVSWCYQQGAGVPADEQKSFKWLYSAVLHWGPFYRIPIEHISKMVYADDFGCLGWG